MRKSRKNMSAYKTYLVYNYYSKLTFESHSVFIMLRIKFSFHKERSFSGSCYYHSFKKLV